MMTENTAASKPEVVAVKSAPAARKPAAQKTAPASGTVKQGKAQSKVAADDSKGVKKAKKEKKTQGKSKVVRDSFTMPQSDYDRIAELKQVCQKAGLHVKKSELLRAGLQALSQLTVPQLERAIVQLTPIKTGRPKKD